MPKIVLTALGIQVNMYFFSRISAKYPTKKQDLKTNKIQTSDPTIEIQNKEIQNKEIQKTRSGKLDPQIESKDRYQKHKVQQTRDQQKHKLQAKQDLKIRSNDRCPKPKIKKTCNSKRPQNQKEI